MKFTFYKYIKISSENDFWLQPLRDGTLYFSSFDELRNVNDPSEFLYTWDSNSHFFKHFFDPHITSAYDRTFSNARVLCLSKSLSSGCWKEFCGINDGICYEFTYLKDNDQSDVSKDHVQYSPLKELNIPNYILKNINNPVIRNLLSLPRLNFLQGLILNTWINSTKDLKDLTLNHIVSEIVFKKLEEFKDENEYRFVQILDPVGPIIPKTKLIASKLSYTDIGLTLEKVHTNKPEQVQSYTKGTPILSVPGKMSYGL